MIKEFVNDFKIQIEYARKNGIRNQIPNILTFSRALAPIFIIPVLLYDKIILAGILLVIFSLTDFFDGRIARKYNCVSEFGIKLDAVCDKIFVLGIVIPAMLKHKILNYILYLELAISVVNLISEAKKNKPRSIMIGKIKTTLLSITLVSVYTPFINIKIVYTIAIITIILQIIVLIRYFVIDRKKDKIKKEIN